MICNPLWRMFGVLLEEQSPLGPKLQLGMTPTLLHPTWRVFGILLMFSLGWIFRRGGCSIPRRWADFSS